MNKAREIFPCGLEQPAGSFRFSQDALVLADFAAAHLEGTRVADVGAGCGVVGLALMLRCGVALCGVDNAEVLVAAARNNAEKLGFEGQYQGICLDVLNQRALKESGLGGSFDVVVTNPPWRLEKGGRLSGSALRRAALFGNREVLPGFVAAARFLLREKGNLFLLAGVERLADTFAALAAQRLQPIRLRFVHSVGTASKACVGEKNCVSKDACFFLVQACKGSRASLRVEAPLYLVQSNKKMKYGADGLTQPTGQPGDQEVAQHPVDNAGHPGVDGPAFQETAQHEEQGKSAAQQAKEKETQGG